MRLGFLIKSSTVNLENYTIKDIPGSSGRLDVISRVIFAAIFGNDGIEKNIEIWIFLDNYGTFILNSNKINEENFPKNEIMLSDNLAKYIFNHKQKNPFEMVKYTELDFFSTLERFINLNYQVFILDEDGQDFYPFFKKFKHTSKLVFIIGDQTGELISSKDLNRFNFTRISLGNQSYLASSVVRLIKLNLKLTI